MMKIHYKELSIMIYISKGIVREHSSEALVRIHHCGKDYQLKGLEAALWLNGQFGFSSAQSSWATEHLQRMGLIEKEADDSPVSRYRILSRCICCPVIPQKQRLPLRRANSDLMRWLEKAGLRLSTAELVYLTEHGIVPSENLLCEENRHALVSLIYTNNSIRENTLELQMEYAKCRDTVVKSLLYLLRRKRLVLV